MFNLNFAKQLGRKTIITGHYGSGKTEFAVSLVLRLASCSGYDRNISPIALIDLDIINPYFRSREQRELLRKSGVEVYGSAFDTEVTAELPALGANIRAPLENNACRVFIDAGGNDTGAMALNQFSKYFMDDTSALAVINASRPDTSSIESAIEHIRAIEYMTKLDVPLLVNNTHMLRETAAADIYRGHEFCEEICRMTGKHLLCDCYPEGIVTPGELAGLSENLMPLGLHMRPTWLDR